MSFEEDYVSLKIDEYDEDEILEDDEAMAVIRSNHHHHDQESEEMKRAKRKRRRRRRKRRMKRHQRNQIALAVGVDPETVKVIDPDELPQRARWTIVATACLLLFMCLLLVGVTLRMAPIIDDMGKNNIYLIDVRRFIYKSNKAKNEFQFKFRKFKLNISL